MRAVYSFCVFAVAFQVISGQFLGQPGFGGGCQSPALVSASIGPGGNMRICSDDLVISGPITVGGKLPFSGTVALEGVLPAGGAGCVNYGCGEPGILTETPVRVVAGYGFR